MLSIDLMLSGEMRDDIATLTSTADLLAKVVAEMRARVDKLSSLGRQESGVWTYDTG